MSKFVMRDRPKKPSQDGILSTPLFCSLTIDELIYEVNLFVKKYPHLTTADITIEYEYDNDYGGLSLQAAGKPFEMRQKETEHYQRAMKEYNLWRATNVDEIAAWKKSEKKRIAHDKLLRAKARAEKELTEIQLKLGKVI